MDIRSVAATFQWNVDVVKIAGGLLSVRFPHEDFTLTHLAAAAVQH